MDRKGSNNPMFGKKHSDKTKQDYSEKRRGKHVGKNNPMFGRHHTDEAREKLKAVNKGTIWINNGLTSKRVSVDMANEFFNEGWQRGRSMDKRQTFNYIRMKFEK